MNIIRLFVLLLLMHPLLLFSKEGSLKNYGSISSGYISSVDIDSSQNTKSIVDKSSFFESLTSEFILTYSPIYDRNIGVGLRANIVPIEHFTVGSIILIYWGADEKYPVDNPDAYSPSPRIGRKYYGYGLLAYIAPEIGVRYKILNSTIESFISYGPAVVRTNQMLDSKNSAMADLSCLCPGVGIKFELGRLKLGFQFRQIIMESLNMSAIFISIGN